MGFGRTLRAVLILIRMPSSIESKRFMGDAAAFSYIAMQEAINDSGLESSDVSNEMTGIIAGQAVLAHRT